MFVRESSPFVRGISPRERMRRAYRRAFVLGTFWGDFQDSFLAPTRADLGADRVLDAGCGQGETLDLFRKKNVPIDYIGVDLAVGDPTWTFRVSAIADLHHLPFKNNSFDKIICNTVLEHVDDPDRVLGEFARVLRPGGRIFLSVPFVWHLHQEPFDRFRFTVHGLRHLIGKHALTEDEIRPMGGYFSVLRYFLNQGWMVWAQWPEPLRAVVRRIDSVRAKLDAWVLAPAFFALDQLDPSPKLTLGYFVQLTKPGSEASLPADPYCCPRCRGSLSRGPEAWRCDTCAKAYELQLGVPVLSMNTTYGPVAGWTATCGSGADPARAG